MSVRRARPLLAFTSPRGVRFACGRRVPPQRCWWVGALTALMAALGCSDGALVTLGEQRERTRTVTEYGTVEKLLSTDGRDENPTLTFDMTEVYLNRGNDIWRAQMVDGVFGDPEPVADLEPEGGTYTSSAISFDGLTLWLAFKRDPIDAEDDATTDIHYATRESRQTAVFSSPKDAGDGVNTVYDERPRPLGQQGRVMPFSRRVDTADGGHLWQTWLATLQDDGSFSEPVLLDQLDEPEVGIVDAFLSHDGLTLLFKREAPGVAGELYWARRRSVADSFVRASPIPGDEINLPDSDERDPWLSEDEKKLYFVSNRDDEDFDIYCATLITRPARD